MTATNGAAATARTEPSTRVSVIIAAWKARDFIDAAIDSALDQASAAIEIEVVVCDDASPDDTYAHLGARAGTEPRLTVLRAARNGGPSAARNHAIERAGGDWLAVLDSDDRFAPGRLARMIERARAADAAVVLDNLREVSETGDPGEAFLSLDRPETWNLARWARDNRMYRTRCTGFLKPLFRRDFIEAHGIRYREEMRNSEDYAIVADCLLAGGRLAYEPVPGYLYTRRAGSLSHRIDPEALDRIIDYASALRQRAEQRVDGETLEALSGHVEALRDARALDEVVGALRTGSPRRLAAGLSRGPRVLPLLVRWAGEVAGKRLRRLRPRPD